MRVDEFFFANFFWHITFVLLFVFTIISVLIAFFSKEKTYVFYALYTFFLLTYILLKTPYLEIQSVLLSYVPPAYNFYSQTLFYSFYIYFFLYFLYISDYFPKLTRKIKVILLYVIVVSTIVFLTAVLTDFTWLFNNYFFYIYVPFNTVMAVIAIIKASQTPGYLKHFFVVGSIFYLILAISALVLSFSNYDHHTPIIIFGSTFYLPPLLFFYIGIFIEQIVFSLGLSYRVKVINEKLQEQSDENLFINKQLNKSLEERNFKIKKLISKVEKERLVQIKSKYESQISKLQLNLLHNQMNPHFIFNALNSIKVYLIENDKKKAVYYLNKFSKLVRNILESSRAETISLEEELDLIKLYVAIEQIRFDDAIHFNIELPEDISLSKFKIPPLILQPFVENAIWHGLSPRSENRKLCLKAIKTNAGLQLKIIDNGVGRDISSQNNQNNNLQKKSLGLKISQERLDLFNERENLNYHFKIVDYKKHNTRGTEVQFMFYEN